MPTANARKTLNWLVRCFRNAQVDFVITGGLAAQSYGAARLLNDIDIDIRNADFATVRSFVEPFLTFGPARYRDQKWDLMLMTLDHEGQIVDIGGGDDVRIYDAENARWIDSPTDFMDFELRQALGVTVPVVAARALIAYKTLLDGAHQKIDIEAVQRFLSGSRT